MSGALLFNGYPAARTLSNAGNWLLPRYFPWLARCWGCSGGVAYLLCPLVTPGPLAVMILSRHFQPAGCILTDWPIPPTALSERWIGKSAEIMRRVVGPMGVCALLFVYLFKYAALLAINAPFFPWPYSQKKTARWAMVLAGAAFALPGRRSGGLFIGELGWRHFLYASF